jgi:mono/diheme cytochrome c family protein
MDFPVFQFTYLGNGMVIALDAVLHVIISHGLAIGAVSFIVMSEYLGLKKSSPDWEDFARDFLKFTIIITTGIGAITGVGIWLITSVISPHGIGSMLRIFFWPWFTEWIVFTGEVIFILIYYFTWSKWTGERKTKHVYLGMGYIFLAVCSALLIAGILGFMLTTDGWPWDKSFWSAFLNPSYIPQLLLRIGIAFSLGSLFSVAFLVFTRRAGPFRTEALKLFGKAALISFSATVICAWWYFSVVPSTFKTHTVFAVLTSRFSQQPEIFWYINGAGAILLFIFSLVSMRGSTVVATILIVPALLVSMGLVSEFERIREFIRGPYLMPGYMYANQILLNENRLLSREGTLKNDFWFNVSSDNQGAAGQGAYLFARNCSSCHTIGGINDIAQKVDGRTSDGIFVILAHTNEMIPFMPPFSGTEDERRTLAGFLYGVSKGTIKLHDPLRFVPVTGGKAHE